MKPETTKELREKVKSTPIIFSAPMVRAILSNRKRMTRRLLSKKFTINGPNPPGASTYDVRKNGEWVGAFGRDGKGNAERLCPFGEAGDRLWVREGWRTLAMWDSLPPRGIPDLANKPFKYEADATINAPTPYPYGKLRPSIFMPRELSRITLEITGVRVERLRNISEADAFDEGVEPWKFGIEQPMTAGGLGASLPYRGGFACLWDDIHEDETWFANPWVWVLSFRRIALQDADVL